jgi:cell division protein FtsB
MAKNRKYQAAAVRFGPAIKAFFLCLFIGGSGVGYVWQKSQINDLGNQILKREHNLADLRDQNEKLRRQVGMLHSPQYIEMRLKELNLGLVQPQPAQIWRMVEPPAVVNPVAPAEYAARRDHQPALP